MQNPQLRTAFRKGNVPEKADLSLSFIQLIFHPDLFHATKIKQSKMLSLLKLNVSS